MPDQPYVYVVAASEQIARDVARQVCERETRWRRLTTPQSVQGLRDCTVHICYRGAEFDEEFAGLVQYLRLAARANFVEVNP
jgi:hypothetical protein